MFSFPSARLASATCFAVATWCACGGRTSAPAERAAPAQAAQPRDTSRGAESTPIPVAKDAARPAAESQGSFEARLARLVADYDAQRQRWRTNASTSAAANDFGDFAARVEALAREAGVGPAATKAWSALLRACGPPLESPSSAATIAGAARERAFAELAAHAGDDRALLPLLDELGLTLALPLGVEPSESFLTRVRETTKDATLRAAAQLARARLWLAALDGLPEGRLDDALKSLRELQASEPVSAWTRAAGDELFAFENLRVQKVVPEVSSIDSDGRALKLSEYRGRVVLLEFWGAWSERSRALVASRAKLLKSFAGEPFDVLWVGSDELPPQEAGFSAEESEWIESFGRPDPAQLATLPERQRTFFEALAAREREHASQLARQLGIPWRQAVDGSTRGPWARRWCVRRWPSSYVIDASGRLRFRDLDDVELALTVRSLVAEARASAPR